MDEQEIAALLATEDEEALSALFHRAYETKQRYCGNKVYLRGIIEFSNRCRKNCYYCGIRRDNRQIERYRLSREAIVAEALWSWKAGYGSVVIQGGEIVSGAQTDFIEACLREIKSKTNGELGITLSLGEQEDESYRRWFEAGAHRYLLRIESSDPDLYRRLHPPSHSYCNRLRCLEALKTIGYQVGTGVLIGLPRQGVRELTRDILFFKQFDVDMIGMGPFIPHDQTPMRRSLPHFDAKRQLQWGLKMIAATRLTLPDINIAATTALQALSPDGREQGILAGANIIMPNVTDRHYRTGYQLYPNKPNLDENADSTRLALEASLAATGSVIGYGEWGDSPHFARRRSPSAANGPGCGSYTVDR